MKFARKILFILFISASVLCSAALDSYTGIFNDRFKSLQIEVDGNPLAPPIIHLNVGDRIVVRFDEIAETNSYLRYSLTHCNADWRQSQLVELEYLDGFNQGDVTDYEYSRNTTVHYVNYRITLPNDDMRILVSGNYLLKVWDESNPDEILLQARFSVSEGGAGLAASVTSRTDVDYNDAHQQLSISVDAEQAGVADVFNDMIVVVSQNGRVDNEVVLPHPLRIAGKKAFYEHKRELIFPAGNEYRRFETVSTSYPSMGVSEISYNDPYYNFALFTDETRSDGSYSYDETQHGRFWVREYNSTESDIEADYVVVHFTLNLPERSDVDIFLDGDFVSRRFEPNSRMVYNKSTGLYERNILVKQGS